MMSPEQFWDLEPAEFHLAIKGWQRVQDAKMQDDWERTRWQTCWLVNLHVKDKLKETDMITFKWDKPKKPIEIPTTDKMAQLSKLHGYKLPGEK